jgi:basic amino acid/polyamine antiporter, APA family
VLLVIGVVLWGVTVLINRRTGPAVPALDPDRFTKGGPVN